MRFQVLISLPSPGFFSPFLHSTGSLSVGKEYLALEDGPPIFSQGFSCPDLLNMSIMHFVYGTITHYGHTFQYVPLRISCSAAPLSLAATQGISVDFFSSGYLDVSVLRVCFHVPMYSVRDNTLWCWVPPFGNPRVNACLSARRGLSQITTSFIASYRLGIHRMRLIS